MRLSNEEFAFLLNELENTHILNDSELGYIKSAHPQLYYTTQNKRDNGVSLYTDKGWVYALDNHNLNNFICKKFDEPVENLYTIHRLIYGVGGLAIKHKDRFTTHKTVSIILSDDFTGGAMYINNELVEMNELRNYIIFDGGKDEHEVKEILSGIRDVLIVWFSKKSSKFSLI